MSDKKGSIKIVSDGTVAGTQVLTADGAPIFGVTNVYTFIDGESISAYIKVVGIELDVAVPEENVQTEVEKASDKPSTEA